MSSARTCSTPSPPTASASSPRPSSWPVRRARRRACRSTSWSARSPSRASRRASERCSPASSSAAARASRTRSRPCAAPAMAAQLFLMMAGALFLAFNVAPTEEMILIGFMMSPWHGIALVAVSLLLLHALVYGVGFAGRRRCRKATAAGELSSLHHRRLRHRACSSASTSCGRSDARTDRDRPDRGTAVGARLSRRDRRSDRPAGGLKDGAMAEAKETVRDAVAGMGGGGHRPASLTLGMLAVIGREAISGEAEPAGDRGRARPRRCDRLRLRRRVRSASTARAARPPRSRSRAR